MQFWSKLYGSVLVFLFVMATAVFAAEELAALRDRAERGDAQAQCALGERYRYGRGVDRDAALAFAWFQKAALQGYADGQSKLGAMYFAGRGQERGAVHFLDAQGRGTGPCPCPGQFGLGLRRGSGGGPGCPLAAEWYGKAYQGLPGMAEAGHPAAQFRVGNMYLMGLGLPKDEKKGLAWIRKAAEAGCITAQAQLDSLYARGGGVAKDEQQAVEWYRKAIAADDYAPAQYNLALMHALGQGMPKDEKKAASLFRQAADQGLPQAQYAVGEMYRTGTGEPRDEKLAAVWFRRGADNGDAMAQCALGRMYLQGRITSPDDGPLTKVRRALSGATAADRQMAALWLGKAAAQGNRDAQRELAALERQAEPFWRSWFRH